MAELTPEQEAAIAAYVQQMYGVWLPVASAAVLAGYNRFGAPPDPAAINATTELWRQQILLLEAQRLEPVAEESYNAEIAGVAGAVAFSAAAPLIAGAAAATLLFLLAQVGEIQGQLRHILVGSRSIADAAAAVAAYLDPSAPHWASKSQQVAQTEGDRWAQAATLAGAVAAQRADGIRRQKVWVSRDDALVRPAHVAADGQKRDLLDMFNVGGFPMLMPLDPRAPAQLVVNCRCKLRIIRQEVSRGR